MSGCVFPCACGYELVTVVGCRSTEGLCERDMHTSLSVLQRPEHHGAEGDGCRRDPSRDRRSHSRVAAQLREQGVLHKLEWDAVAVSSVVNLFAVLFPASRCTVPPKPSPFCLEKCQDGFAHNFYGIITPTVRESDVLVKTSNTFSYLLCWCNYSWLT